jgi:hypothetical protein
MTNFKFLFSVCLAALFGLENDIKKISGFQEVLVYYKAGFRKPLRNAIAVSVSFWKPRLRVISVF